MTMARKVGKSKFCGANDTEVETEKRREVERERERERQGAMKRKRHVRSGREKRTVRVIEGCKRGNARER